VLAFPPARAGGVGKTLNGTDRKPLGAARALGELFRRRGQPPLTAEVLVGVILGPTVLGTYAPAIHQMIFPPDPVQQYMLETVSWIGVLFLLLSSGLDVDLSVAWKQRKSSLIIALSDIFLPLLTGFGLAMLIPDEQIVGDRRFLFAVFVGTALTISDLPIALRALNDTNILRSDLGLLILSALTINDIIGWVIFTVTLSLAAEVVGLGYVAGVFIGTIGFAAICLLPGRKAVSFVFNKVHSLNLPQPGTSLTMVVLLGTLCGLITQMMGIHASSPALWSPKTRRCPSASVRSSTRWSTRFSCRCFSSASGFA